MNTDCEKLTVRVTSVHSHDPHGFGGAIFSGVVLVDWHEVNGASSLVVCASNSVLCGQKVQKGQLWHVSGRIETRSLTINGIIKAEQQMQAREAMMLRPNGELIIGFLADNPEFAGIGPVKARRLWERFGQGLYAILDGGQTQRLAPILTDDIAKRLVDAWKSNEQSQSLLTFTRYGFDARLVRKLLDYFGPEAMARIEQDPYRMLSFCASWPQVDALSLRWFITDPCDPRRLQGAVEQACYDLMDQGDTLIEHDWLEQSVARLVPDLSVEPSWNEHFDLAMSTAQANAVVLKTDFGLHLPGCLLMERQVATAIHTRLTEPAVLANATQVDAVIERVKAQDGIELNDQQRAAIHLAATHAFACIIGGAGVGKTTTLKALYHLYDEQGVQIVQVALAARAAKRMQEATGRPAFTIARFLSSNAAVGMLPPAVLVIDEASMLDIISMSSMCQALGEKVRIVLVGDPHQLMPIGAGLVLHSLLKHGDVPTVELKTAKRFGSEIALIANSIRAGVWRQIYSIYDMMPIAFVECEDQDIATEVSSLYDFGFFTTQIISPVRKGFGGTECINECVQQRVSGFEQRIGFWNVEHNTYHTAAFGKYDMVLCTRNLVDKNLQNGSLGRIVEIEDNADPTNCKADQILAWIDWDDGQCRPLTIDMLGDIELGFAITVHKAQGSQWKRVIVPVTKSRMLDRTMLYTAITRAQENVILIGDLDAAKRAVAALPRFERRRVALDQILHNMVGSPTGDIMACV